MTIILAKQEKVSYLKLTYVLYDSLEKIETDLSRRNEFVDKCDTTGQGRVWLFSSFDNNRIYNKIIRNLVRPLKYVSLNDDKVIGIVDDIRRFTEGSLSYRALILNEFSQGDMIEVENGQAKTCDTFLQYPCKEGLDEVKLILRRFDIIPRILKADISSLNKMPLRGRINWVFIKFIKRLRPDLVAMTMESAPNNYFEQTFKGIHNILLTATGELGIEIKKVIDRIEDPLDRKFDFPLYAKFILSSYNKGDLWNYIHNMNSPLKFDRGFNIELFPRFKILVSNGRPYFG